MKLFFGDTFIEIQPNDNSKAVEKVRAVDTFTVYFSAPGYVDIPVGAWTTFEGKRYELLNPKNFKKHNTRNFEYTLVLEDEAGKLRRYKYRDSTTRRLKFEYTARPHEFIEMLVYNLNKRDPGWTVGDCIEAVEKHVAFNHTDCFNALEQIADAFSTEWEIENKRISLRKVEYFKDNPLPLSYGKGNGFKPGVGQANQDKKSPVEILFPQGSTRNIDASTYGSTELLLPKNQIIGFDGANYYYDPSEVPAGREVRWYITDADGFSVSRKDKAFVTFAEESLDCSHIYPSRVGTISSVVVVDAEKHLYDIIDTSIPSDLDFSKCLIQGSTLTIIPQEGMLAGKEFDAKYIHADRRFEIVPQDLDGRTMPDETFKPLVGQKYAVFGMMMPDAYICDNPSHTGASWDMLRECVRFFFDNEHPHFSCTAELDSIFAQKDWINIGGRIRKGAFIQFSDPQFQPEGADIRIVTVTRPANTPKKPKIELSNMTVSSSIVGELSKITENEVVAENYYREALQFSKRRYRDAIETIEMLEGAFLHFSESIDPIAVRTMLLLVGDESLQYRFVNNKTNPQAVPYNIVFDAATKQLKCPAGIIQHMTLGIKDISSAHKASDYNFWNLPAFVSARLDDPAKKYYLYIKASTTTQSAEFRLSETGIEMNAEAGYYHFLAGVLNSEYDGVRSWAKMYGFTEILPGQITVERIVSEDGMNFIDFLNNAVRVGNESIFIQWMNGVMRMKGVIVQSPSGAEDAIGVFRGNYDTSGRTTYYKGEEVFYKGATYRYINDIPQAGIEPGVSTNWRSYWAIKANAGKYTTYVYQAAASKPSRPSGTALVPYGWLAQPPSVASGDSISNLSYSGANWTSSGDYKRSPAIGNSGITKQRLTFTTSKANAVVNFEIYASSESGYDFMLIGLPNNSNLSRDSNYTDRVSGSGESKIVSVTFPYAGTNYIEFAYAKDGSATSGGDYGMWRVSSGSVVWASTSVVEMNAAGEWAATAWSDPWQISGTSGKDGAAGPMPRGPVQWDRDTQYEGTNDIVDVVFVLDTDGKTPIFYKAKAGVGTIPAGTSVTNTAFWQQMNRYDSIATGLLLADDAIIAQLVFHDGKLISQTGYLSGNVSTDYTNPNFVPNISIDGKTGRAEFNDITLNSNSSGSKIRIDPTNRVLQLVNSNGLVSGEWSFSANYGSTITLQSGGGEKMRISSGSIDITRPDGTAMDLDGHNIMTSSGQGSKAKQFWVNNFPSNPYLNITILGLPTSSSGLHSGQLWRDGNTLKIV